MLTRRQTGTKPYSLLRSGRSGALTSALPGMRNAFSESEKRVAKATQLRNDRRKVLGGWAVVRMRIKDIIDLGDAGYGAAKRRQEMLMKARHVLKCEKALQNSLVWESRKAARRLKEVNEDLESRGPPPVVEEGFGEEAKAQSLPPLKEIVDICFRENNKLMELRNQLKQTTKEKESWEKSKEDNAAGMVTSCVIRISIIEEELTEQQRIVDEKEATLVAVRARIARGGPETDQERFLRLNHERESLMTEKANLERKLADTEGAVSDRFKSVTELRVEQETAKRYQDTAQARVDILTAKLTKLRKWQKVAVEVRRALENERDGLKWAVKNNNSLTPDVRLAMQEKVDAMIDQLAEEKQKAIDLTDEKAELEREIALLEGRIKKSKDDVAY